MTEWEWYTDGNVFRVFMHLLLTANPEDRKWKGIVVKRGQVVTGRKALAEVLGLSEQQVRTALEKLKSTNEITSKTTNKFTIITICKYDSYQSKKRTTNQRNNQQDNQQITTPKEYKNNNISSSTTTTRARESVAEEVEELKEDYSWKEIVCMNRHLTPYQLDSYLDEFLGSCQEREIKNHNDLGDAKRHFVDWLTKRKQNEGNTTDRTDDRRRGSFVVAPTGNYEGAF